MNPRHGGTPTTLIEAIGDAAETLHGERDPVVVETFNEHILEYLAQVFNQLTLHDNIDVATAGLRLWESIKRRPE